MLQASNEHAVSEQVCRSTPRVSSQSLRPRFPKSQPGFALTEAPGDLRKKTGSGWLRVPAKSARPEEEAVHEFPKVFRTSSASASHGISWFWRCVEQQHLDFPTLDS